MKTIYFDHAATTYMDSSVVDVMKPYYDLLYGNPSSIHQMGRQARLALDDAREQIADALGTEPSSLIFTSGGTESNNASLFGVTFAQNTNKVHCIVSAVEHQAVLETANQLQRFGVDVSIVTCDEFGYISPSAVEQAIRPHTMLISVMMGNNEVGTIQPIAEIGQLARKKGICFHVDAVQALGWIPIQLNQLPVDLMSFSSHKIHGPKGMGLLYMNRSVKWMPYLFGGAQERKRRAGTENVAGIVGFAQAVTNTVLQREQRVAIVERLRDLLYEQLILSIGEDAVIRNGHPSEVLPHILNVSFPWMDTETMVMNLDLAGICVSSGSACSSGSFQPSHVLKAMQLSPERMRSAVRFSFAENNTIDDVHRAVEVVKQLHLRSMARSKGGGSIG